MDKIILFCLTALTLNLGAEEIAAQDGCSPPPPASCPVKPSQCSKPCTPLPPACTPSSLCTAVPMSSNGWYLFADVLYWHADVGDSDYAFKNTNTASPIKAGPNYALNFKWSWGFRVGLGANMDYDQWDSNFYYTGFDTQNSNAVGTKTGQDATDLVGTIGIVTQGKINWKIHYSMFDWELGRWFYVSKHLSIRPHVGVKGGWINQKVKKSFTTATTTWLDHMTNDFWGVGGSGGFNTKWMFAHVRTHNFSIFGDFAGAIMYGHFKVKDSELSAAGTGFVPSHLSHNRAVPMLQTMLGLSWDTGFNCNRCHFGLRVGYEFQYWWKQNQMLAFESESPVNTRYQRANSDLALQGLTIDFKFDF
jgi:opacity protein-like surface antigen